MTRTGLYIHVPFCAVKCPYCDFYSAKYSRKTTEDYTQAVIRNLNRYLENNPELGFDTVYFGGGTPSLMQPDFFYGIMDTISSRLCSGDPEISIEVNPKTVNYDKLKSFISCGINRLSVGIQSAEEKELEGLGRKHSFADAEKTIELAFKTGFCNISADLMIGILHQSTDSLLRSCEKLSDMSLQHISAYMLKIEQGTEYFKNGISSAVPGEDETADMYLALVKKLDELGYSQYEISNFSKKGFESRHNLKYWRCEEYVGIGPSAHSYYNGFRYEVPRDLSAFILKEHQEEIVNEKNPGSFFEKAMLKLRLSEGLPLSECGEFRERIVNNFNRLKKSGLVCLENDTLKLTPEGFLISNYLISEILS